MDATAEANAQANTAPICAMRIRDDVYWYENDGQVIIVAMESGKYFALDTAGIQVWKALVSGIDVQGPMFCDSEDNAARANVSRTLSTLLDRGLIESTEHGRSARPSRHKRFETFLYSIAAYRSRRGVTQVSFWKRLWLFAEAYLLLICVDIALRRIGFHGLFSVFSNAARSFPSISSKNEKLEWLCGISLSAFRWYRPNVACVHRAASAYLFLRRHGIAAELCLGVDPRPFESHTWVEFKGRVVGDSQGFCNSYRVIARVY